jgi:C_GCAxxG_C_C family probable redox protein
MQNQAIENFRAGYNCAQAVLTEFSDRYGLDEKAALSISCGFGGGMGRLQETCGAVTGAFMVLGMHNCRLYPDNQERKAKTYIMVQAFDREFRKIHSAIRCGELLKIDLKTPEGQQLFHSNHLDEVVCEKCIVSAIAITEKLIAQQ